MTFNVGHIEGGTNAGWRTTRVQVRVNWVCSCGQENKYYWNNCPGCKKPKP